MEALQKQWIGVWSSCCIWSWSWRNQLRVRADSKSRVSGLVIFRPPKSGLRLPFFKMDVGATFTQAEIDEEPFEVISEAEVLAPPSMDLRDLSKEEVETIRAVLERHRMLECEEISYMRWERWTGMGMDKCLLHVEGEWCVEQGVCGLHKEKNPVVLFSN